MKFTQQVGFFMRSFFLQAGWNYQKYQNIGLLFIMRPFLSRLYKKDPKKLEDAVARYLATFNTQPILASFCFGALAKQEEHIAHAQNFAETHEETQAWNTIKRGLSITTASIGDRLFWGTLKPLTLLLALFIWLVLGVHIFESTPELPLPCLYVWAGSIAAFLAFNVIALFVKWEGFKTSYKAVYGACYGLTSFDWNKTIYNAKKIGLVLTVAMILLGIYYYLREFQQSIDVHFITRAVIVLFFVCISFITRRLRIPNMYLYLAAVVVFNLVCYL